MDILQRIKVYTKRSSQGNLFFPRCVAAHLDEIEKYAPDAITEEDRKRICNGEEKEEV